MGRWELLLIALALSMDAFSVSVCKGLSLRGPEPRRALLIGLYFGGFQFLMPLLGWGLGARFEHLIRVVDHWIAFGLLSLIGLGMIRASLGKAEALSDDFGFKTMLPLAVATSIDALAVGVTFAFLQASILPAAGLIGVTAFLLSALGLRLGAVFGERFRSGAELTGGLILLLIGLKILLEHLGAIRLPF